MIWFFFLFDIHLISHLWRFFWIFFSFCWLKFDIYTFAICISRFLSFYSLFMFIDWLIIIIIILNCFATFFKKIFKYRNRYDSDYNQQWWWLQECFICIFYVFFSDCNRFFLVCFVYLVFLNTKKFFRNDHEINSVCIRGNLSLSSLDWYSFLIWPIRVQIDFRMFFRMLVVVSYSFLFFGMKYFLCKQINN